MKYISILSLLLLFISCTDVKHPDADRVRDQLPLRKVMRVEPKEITAEADRRADSLFTSNASLRFEEWSAQPAVAIYKVSDSLSLSPENKLLLDAYLYAQQVGLDAGRNVQEIEGGDYVYSEVLTTSDSVKALVCYKIDKKEVVKHIMTQK